MPGFVCFGITVISPETKRFAWISICSAAFPQTSSGWRVVREALFERASVSEPASFPFHCLKKIPRVREAVRFKVMNWRPIAGLTEKFEAPIR